MPETQNETSPGPRLERSQVRVLVVEDSPLQAKLVERSLVAAGFQVEVAREGAEAWEAIQRQTPTVVVSDVEMPVMDGYELCRKIRADHSLARLPIMLFTNMSAAEDVVHGLNAGADGYLTKPCEAEVLIDRIESMLVDQQAPAGPLGELQITVSGKPYFVRSTRNQMLSLLISTFENGVRQNRNLADTNKSLTVLQQELAQRAQQLETLNGQKDRLLGMAAHDLRNPLGAIQAYTQFLLQDKNTLTEQQLKFAERINHLSQHVLKLVEDLLDVATVESGHMELDCLEVDVTALLRSSLEVQTLLAEKKQIKLETEYPALPVRRRLDPAKFEQVLSNLLSNAIKYSHPGSTVRVNLAEMPDGAVVLNVVDQGVGIAADQHDRVFQAFGRTTARPTGGETSTGLGLAIVKNIVEMHGGRIGFQSEPGQGTTFTVVLPATS